MAGNQKKNGEQFAVTCIYCNGKGASKQHIWPNWLGNVLPKSNKSHFSHNGKLRVADNGKLQQYERNVSDRQGNLGQRKMKSVCNKCNTGWMNAIEQEAKPILEPLIKGSNMLIGEKEREILARWITLTCISAEFTDVSTMAIPNSDRQILYKQRKPGPGWKIWIGKVEKHYTQVNYKHRNAEFAEFNFAHMRRLKEHSSASQTSTMIIGELVIHVFSTSENFIYDIPREVIKKMILIYPYHRFWLFPKKNQFFPAKEIISIPDYEFLSNNLFRVVKLKNDFTLNRH